MSDKSIWQGFGDLLGCKGGGKALTTVEQRCPECHNALDPRGAKCPYCEAARNASKQSTRLAPEPPVQPASPPTRGATQIDLDEMPAMSAVSSGAAVMAAEPGTGSSVRRNTVVEPVSEGSLGVERRVGGGRRITGIVTTFKWSRLGQLYVVRRRVPGQRGDQGGHHTVFKFQKIVAAAGPTHEPAREQHQGWRLADNEEPVA